MSVIQDREYVEKTENKFFPTELGFIVNDLLVESFADIFNVEYTARIPCADSSCPIIGTPR